MTLTPQGAGLRPGEPAAIDVVGALSLRRAGLRPRRLRRGRRSQAAHGSGIKGLEGFADRPRRTRRSRPSTAEIEEHGDHRRAGPRDHRRCRSRTLAAPRPTEAKITLRVGEPGGRAVERSLTLPILPDGPVVGVQEALRRRPRRGRERDLRRRHGRARRDAPRQHGTSPGRSVAVERRYQWFSADGRWCYEPVKLDPPHRRRHASTSTADAAGRIAAPVQWGTYRLDVRRRTGATAQTSVSFTVGWSRRRDGGHAGPPRHDASTRRPTRAGETMRRASAAALRRQGDARGRERPGPRDPRGRRRRRRAPSVEHPGQGRMGRRAPISSALAHRPLDRAAKRLPGRALGLAWFAVDRDSAHARGRPRGARADAAARRP